MLSTAKVHAAVFGETKPQDYALSILLSRMLLAPATYLIGNGGSASICSHIAVDYCKYLGVKARSLNDPMMLSCVANDYGWESVFRKQLEWYASPKDALIAISSSGASPNILGAARWAAEEGLFVVTLSAFKPNNPLREKGAINFYVDTVKYRVAEITHLSILHELADV